MRKASLHHHFPSKADLGLALIESYAAKLNHELTRINGLGVSAKEKLEAYANIYHSTLEADRMCMGGMLASETLTLDDTMLPSLKRFFALNTEWLTEVLIEGESQHLFALKSTAASHARLLLSAFQGSLLVARATGDHDAFDETALLLISGLMPNK